MPEHVDAYLADWAAAEQAGDTETLAALLTDDFSGVGPLGFVLPRPAWLARHRQGLAYERFDLDEVQVRHCGNVAVVAARGTYRGQPLPEAARATLVLVSDSEARRLATIHMSFIAGTPGSPPMPAPIDSAERR